MLGVIDEHLPGLLNQSQMMKFDAHLSGVAHAVADLKGLLVPVLGFVELVLSVADRAQGVVDQDGVLLVPVFLQDLPSPLIPTGGLVVFELVLGAQAQGSVVLDHLFGVAHSLVYLQGFAEPFLGFGVASAVLADHAQAVIIVGHRLLVFSVFDDGQRLCIELLGFLKLPAVLGYLAHLVEHRGGAGIGLAVFLLRKVFKKLFVQGVGSFELLGLDALAGLGAHQIQPELYAAGLLRFFGGYAGGLKQLAAQPAQFWVALLHAEDLRQRLDQQLSVLPLACFKGEGQSLGDVSLLGQDGGGAGVLVLIEGLHEVVGGVGVNAHDLVLQLLDGALRELTVEAASQEPGQRRMYLVDAGGDGLQETAGAGVPEEGPAGAVAKLFAGHRLVGLSLAGDVG